MFLGAALQLTNAYGDVFLDDFKHLPEYADSIVVKYSTIIMSISQISETLFILAIPFFLKRFGIKQVMLFSMIALGTSIWIICIWESRRWFMDDYFIMYSLWNGV